MNRVRLYESLPTHTLTQQPHCPYHELFHRIVQVYHRPLPSPIHPLYSLLPAQHGKSRPVYTRPLYQKELEAHRRQRRQGMPISAYSFRFVISISRHASPLI